MRIAVILALCGALLFSATLPARAQAEHPPEASGFCLDRQTQLGPEIDSLLANETPEESLQVAYQASLRVALISAACADAPETNTYTAVTAPTLDKLRTELATETAGKCNAIGSDLNARLSSNTNLVTTAPEQLLILTSALRQLNGLLIEACPADLQAALTQLSGNFDRIEDGARQWPVCNASRDALSAAMDAFQLQMQDPATDPQVAQDAAFRPAVDTFRQACAIEQNWMTDKESNITHLETMMTERTPDVRQACTVAMIEVDQRLDAISARSAAYKPGCADEFELEFANLDDKNAIETVFNNMCRLFPAATEAQRHRFERELRLVDELYAEHVVIRYRQESGEEDAGACSP